MMQIAKHIFWIVAAVLICGCASSNQSNPTPKYSSDGSTYTSSFPARNVSKKLSDIQASVFRITSTAIYTTYFFDDGSITFEELRKANLAEVATRRSSIDKSKAGTAVSILQNNRHVALLTAEHVLHAPDTLISYKRGENIPQNKFIESAGIKIEQRNFLHTFRDLLEIDVLAENPGEDLALINVDRPSGSFDAPPLKIRTGTAKDLTFGSFLYVLGYPLGTPMVTRGIVSAPDYDNQGTFLTDALFNHGISGGLILATRDNFNSFEWVGMSVTASASEQFFLVPNPSRDDQYQNLETYTDTAFLAQKSIINYGVTQATPIEKILRFLYSNEDKLNRLGLSVTDLGGQ